MANFFNSFSKKFSNQPEPEDLDTGYDSDYYDSAYRGGDDRAERRDDRVERVDREERREASRGYDEPAYRDRGYREDDRYGERRDDRYAYGDRRDSYEGGYGRGYREADAPSYRPYEPTRREPARPANMGTLYFTPEAYGECREAVVSGLMGSHVVVVNIAELEAADLMRLLDYIMGAAQVLESDMFRLNASTLVFTPKGVEIDESEIKLPEEDAEEEAYEEYDDGDAEA